MAREEPEILDRALLADHGREHHDSLYAGTPRQSRICRLYSANQISLAHVGEAQGMSNRRRRSRRQNRLGAGLEPAGKAMRISASCSRNIESKSRRLDTRRSVIADRLHVYGEG